MDELITTIETFPKPFEFGSSPYNKSDFNQRIERMRDDYIKLGLKRVFKVIVLGDVMVGKTSIVNSFCYKLFDCNYKATIGVDFEIQLFAIFKMQFALQLWDTAGQERFKCIAQAYYRAAHAIMIVFDLSDLTTLANCETWLDEALSAGNSSDSFVFLVGNKRDALSSAAYKNMEELAVEVAKKLHAEYWSVSAKTGDNVIQLFLRIAALVFDRSSAEELDVVTNKLHAEDDLISLKKKRRKSKGRPKCSCSF